MLFSQDAFFCLEKWKGEGWHDKPWGRSWLEGPENELKVKEPKQPSQGKTASEWQSSNLNPKLCDLRAQTLNKVVKGEKLNKQLTEKYKWSKKKTTK